MKSLSIRSRMTLWQGLVMTVLVCLFVTAIYWLTMRRFAARIDFELVEEVEEVIQEIADEPNQAALLRELQSEFALHPDYEYEILDQQGATFFESQRLLNLASLFDRNDQSDSDRVRRWLATHNAGNNDYTEVVVPKLGVYRVLRRHAESPYGPLLLQVAIPLQPLMDLQNDLIRTLCWLGPAILLVALGCGYWLAGRMLAPIAEMTTTASTITAQQLKQRLDVSGSEDELTRLARTLNAMLDRIDRAFDDMQRFTADAAHELRTPLTVMRTQLDVALRTDRTAGAYRSALESVRDDVIRMTKLATQLLELAREDAGLDSPDLIPLALDEVVQSAVQQFLPEANRKGVKIDISLQPITVCGDAERLQRVVLNVLNNAVKFTPTSGCVSVRLSRTNNDQTARLEITDTGPGISAEHLPRVCDRFYRTDASRSTSGTGLGLAICKAIVLAHGGQLTVTSPTSDSPPIVQLNPQSALLGTAVIIELPSKL